MMYRFPFYIGHPEFVAEEQDTASIFLWGDEERGWSTLSHVADRALVLRPGVRTVPLK